MKLIRKLFLLLPFTRDWEIIQEETYRNFQEEELGIVKTYKMRKCRKTGKIQYLDVHCLGLNPPEYIRNWCEYKGQNERK